jgi:hypothetical protein
MDDKTRGIGILIGCLVAIMLWGAGSIAFGAMLGFVCYRIWGVVQPLWVWTIAGLVLSGLFSTAKSTRSSNE